MIIITILFVCIALVAGFCLGYLIRHLMRNVSDYAGVMKIVKEENRMLYSLELYEDPSVLEHLREVVFKVETSDEGSDRK